jgi:hypothetical protein
MKFCHLKVNGWNWKKSAKVKIANFRSPKAAFFSHMWNIDPIQIQQYYEKQVTLRGGHI